jgi:hypothetical protein
MVQAGRRELESLSIEQGADLLLGATDRSGRANDLGTSTLARAKTVNRDLIESRDRAERARDKVQLVLNNEAWRWERRPDAKQTTCLWLANDLGEFVRCANN